MSITTCRSLSAIIVFGDVPTWSVPVPNDSNLSIRLKSISCAGAVLGQRTAPAQSHATAIAVCKRFIGRLAHVAPRIPCSSLTLSVASVRPDRGCYQSARRCPQTQCPFFQVSADLRFWHEKGAAIEWPQGKDTPPGRQCSDNKAPEGPRGSVTSHHKHYPAISQSAGFASSAAFRL